MVGIRYLARGEARKIVPVHRCFKFWMELCSARSTCDQSLGDYWSHKEKEQNMSYKEMLAMCNALEACPKQIGDCRVDVRVDSRVAVDIYDGQGSRKSRKFNDVTKQLYEVVVERNLQLELCFVPSKENHADGPSRRISAVGAMLSAKAWQRVERLEISSEHIFDLMDLDSNAQQDRNGLALPYFTPCGSPQFKGINFFAQDLTESEHDLFNMYVYLPFLRTNVVNHSRL